MDIDAKVPQFPGVVYNTSKLDLGRDGGDDRVDFCLDTRKQWVFNYLFDDSDGLALWYEHE